MFLLQSHLVDSATRLGYTPHEARTVVLFRNFDEELKCPGVWETDQGATSTTDASRDNLATLYRLPFALMYHGPFEKVLRVITKASLPHNQKGLRTGTHIYLIFSSLIVLLCIICTNDLYKLPMIRCYRNRTRFSNFLSYSHPFLSYTNPLLG